MACNQPDHPRLTNSLAPVFVPLASGQSPDTTSPALAVSNAPESLVAITSAVSLYKCEIPLVPLQSKTVRFFVWHINNSPASIEFALMVASSTPGSYIDIESLKAEIALAPDEPGLLVAGICLAKAQLYGTAGAITPSQDSFGNEGFVLKSASAPSGQAVCWMIEATFSSLDSSHLRIWMAARGGSTYAWTDYSATPVGPGNQVTGGLYTGPVHVRGWLPYSRVFCIGNQTSINCCPSETAEVVQGVLGDAAGGDTLSFAPQSVAIDPYCAVKVTGERKGNEGLYGANIVYRFFADNKCETDGNCHAYIRARNTGGEGKVWGAARISQPSMDKKGVKKIRYLAADSNPLLNFSCLTDDSPIKVPKNTDPHMEVHLEFASGGAAALPVNAVLRTKSLEDESS